jgi:hypothetical protein
VYLYFYERSIIKRDHKITIKFKRFIKHREVNTKYFKKNITSLSVIFNTKTGNIQTVTFEKYGKTENTIIRTNNFHKLDKSLKNILFAKAHFINKDQKNKFEGELTKIFNDKEFKKIFFESLSIENNGLFDKSYSKDLLVIFINYFISKKDIKVPDVNYVHLLTNFYPTEKYLKKNKRKLIASILDMFGFKSKQTIKLLHQYPNIDIQSFIKLCSMFGENYNEHLANINKMVFQIANSKFTIETDTYNSNHPTTKETILNFLNVNKSEYTEQEKKFFVKLLNCVEGITSRNTLNVPFLIQLSDHINMYRRILVYDPNLKLQAKNVQELNDEHVELSKMISIINKGWVIEYQFNENTIKEIEQEYIVLNGNGENIKLYPHLLKREEEYTEEGNFMHHCVASYSDKDKSIIVSVRTKDSQDRITIEFDIQTGRMIQARHFCNASTPDLYEPVIEKLKTTISRMARYGTLNWKEKKKVPLKINGVEINKAEVQTQLFF